MTILGLRHTENFVANERPLNWRMGILRRYPNGQAPLLALTSLIKDEVTDDPEFKWWDKPLEDRRPRITSNLLVVVGNDTVTCAATVDGSSGALGLKRGDILRVMATGEHLWVSSDPTIDTQIPVVRGYAGTTPTALDVSTTNPYMFVIGSSFEEASPAPTGVNFDPKNYTNYTQIFRSTLEMSRTAQKTKLRTGDQVKEAKRECSEYFSIDMERALWMSKKSIGTFQGKPRRTTDGVFAQIDPANIIDQAGTPVDMETLENWMELVFRFGSNEKVAYCGNRAILGINRAVRRNSTWNIQSGIKEYGMAVTRLICPFGELVLKTHPLWNQDRSNLQASGGIPVFYGMDSWLCVLDQKEIIYRYLTDSDVKFQQDLAENGLDGMKSGYIAECGLELHHPPSHALFKGIVDGAVDA